ncbi:MAG: cytochrome c biogenesis protein CcsA [Hahellaceae bacterium]|nr:cytochrome c biogenesis protein CcsA [Hahellaceae bacterium]MCP5212400.1 cytochrome c biogenesis protein CcsA [Hahellaceae bacterium]
MSILFFGLTATLMYLAGITYQLIIFQQKAGSRPFIRILIGFVAAASHLIVSFQAIQSTSSLDFSFFKASSLIASLITFIFLIFSLKKPVENLSLAVYPIAILTLLSMAFFDLPAHQLKIESAGILTHISFSVLAYSMFTLAAAQAALLYWQNKALRARQFNRFTKSMPPLQTMEKLLFEMLTSGWVMLTLAIAFGIVFVDNIFAQHLAHKTAFSLLAWAVFGTLLLGNKVYGWRGSTASKWTLWGCLLLMLGYFGSKFALEFIIATQA